MTDEVLVSVSVVAYNHEGYIRQTLENIVGQKCNFKYEIVIGEDFSTDSTREIIKEYADKYPYLIRALYHDNNVGPIMNNYLCLNACSGKYIATCDGDDYWIDEKKLQKQVDFLENNPDFSICAHNVYSLVSDKRFMKKNIVATYTIYDINDFAVGNKINSCSVVAKNIVAKLPDWFTEILLADYVRSIFNCVDGKVMVFDDFMAVRRVHNSGIWSGSSIINRCIILNETLDKLIVEFKGNEELCDNFKSQGINAYLDTLRELLKIEKYDDYYILLRQAILKYEEFWPIFSNYDKAKHQTLNKWNKNVFIKGIKKILNKN